MILVGRRQQKSNRVVSIQLLTKARLLRGDQAEQFEDMLRKCRTDQEFEQVSTLVHQTCEDNKKTRYGKLASGDPLGFDDPDD